MTSSLKNKFHFRGHGFRTWSHQVHLDAREHRLEYILIHAELLHSLHWNKNPPVTVLRQYLESDIAKSKLPSNLLHIWMNVLARAGDSSILQLSLDSNIKSEGVPHIGSLCLNYSLAEFFDAAADDEGRARYLSDLSNLDADQIGSLIQYYVLDAGTAIKHQNQLSKIIRSTLVMDDTSPCRTYLARMSQGSDLETAFPATTLWRELLHDYVIRKRHVTKKARALLERAVDRFEGDLRSYQTTVIDRWHDYLDSYRTCPLMEGRLGEHVIVHDMILAIMNSPRHVNPLWHNFAHQYLNAHMNNVHDLTFERFFAAAARLDSNLDDVGRRREHSPEMEQRYRQRVDLRNASHHDDIFTTSNIEDNVSSLPPPPTPRNTFTAVDSGSACHFSLKSQDRIRNGIQLSNLAHTHSQDHCGHQRRTRQAHPIAITPDIEISEARYNSSADPFDYESEQDAEDSEDSDLPFAGSVIIHNTDIRSADIDHDALRDVQEQLQARMSAVQPVLHRSSILESKEINHHLPESFENHFEEPIDDSTKSLTSSTLSIHDDVSPVISAAALERLDDDYALHADNTLEADNISSIEKCAEKIIHVKWRLTCDLYSFSKSFDDHHAQIGDSTRSTIECDNDLKPGAVTVIVLDGVTHFERNAVSREGEGLHAELSQTTAQSIYHGEQTVDTHDSLGLFKRSMESMGKGGVVSKIYSDGSLPQLNHRRDSMYAESANYERIDILSISKSHESSFQDGGTLSEIDIKIEYQETVSLVDGGKDVFATIDKGRIGSQKQIELELFDRLVDDYDKWNHYHNIKDKSLGNGLVDEHVMSVYGQSQIGITIYSDNGGKTTLFDFEPYLRDNDSITYQTYLTILQLIAVKVVENFAYLHLMQIFAVQLPLPCELELLLSTLPKWRSS